MSEPAAVLPVLLLWQYNLCGTLAEIVSTCVSVTFSRRVGLHYVGAPAFDSSRAAGVYECALRCADASPTPCRAAGYDTAGQLCDLFQSAAPVVPTLTRLTPADDRPTVVNEGRSARHVEAVDRAQRFGFGSATPAVRAAPLRSFPLAQLLTVLFGGRARHRLKRQTAQSWQWSSAALGHGDVRSAGRQRNFEIDLDRIYIWQVTCLEWSSTDAARSVVVAPFSTIETTAQPTTSASYSANDENKNNTYEVESCPPYHVQYSVVMGHALSDPALHTTTAPVSEHSCAVACYNEPLCTAANFDGRFGTCQLTSAFLWPSNREKLRRYETALRLGSAHVPAHARMTPTLAHRSGRPTDVVIREVRCYKNVTQLRGQLPEPPARHQPPRFTPTSRPKPPAVRGRAISPPPYDPVLARNLATGLSAILTGAPGATAKSKEVGTVLPKIVSMINALESAKPGGGGGGSDFGISDIINPAAPPPVQRPPPPIPSSQPHTGINPASPSAPTAAPSPSAGAAGDGRFLAGVNAAHCGRPAVLPSVPRLDEDSVEFGQTRIVGGTEARPHSWPWQASLRYYGVHVCGASIIGQYALVTAAHCVYSNPSASAYTVVAGSHYRQKDEDTSRQHSVYKIIVHPNYNEPMRHANDVALVLLSGAGFDFGGADGRTAPVCLAQRVAEAGTQCVITGWGLTDQRSVSDHLRQAVVPIVPWSVCNDAKHYAGRIDRQSMLCAGYDQGEKDSCQGDSGGPLVCPADGSGRRWELAGAVSWGFGCARRYKPGVYADVARLRHWLLQALATAA